MYINHAMGLDGLGFELWQWQDIFLMSKMSRSVLGLPSFQFKGYQGSFLEVKQPRHYVYHSPPSSAVLMNICLHDMNMGFVYYLSVSNCIIK